MKRIRSNRFIKIVLIAQVILVFNNVARAQDKDLFEAQNACQEIQEFWLKEALHLTKVSVGFSAPVAARSLMYFNVGLYEASLLVLPNNQSLSRQLSNFERQTWPNDGEELKASLVNNLVAYLLIQHLYKNRPQNETVGLDLKYKSKLKNYSKGVNRKEIKASLLYGETLANEIIQWSKLDGGDEAYSRNFPKSYVLPECDSCWARTFPGYNFALQPYWGENVLMIKENSTLSAGIPFMGFSTDSNSLIFKDAKAIYNLYSNGTYTKEMKTIAEYWNDSPGFSGTPSGHFFAMALNLTKERELNFKTSCELFACLGIAINDAVIESFRLKYQFNLLRPITYINRYIGKDFNTVIASPSFPEFPSGHSYQSGAGSEVLIAFLSDDFSFTDDTNKDRRDINGTPRSFENITAMSEEISISRYYGGIHFLYTLNTSLVYGRKIGVNTVSQLKFDK